MSDTITYPTRREVLLHRECQPATPYQTGYEHYRYLHIYQPPYHIGSPEWVAYNQGNQDARKTAEQERI